VRSQEYSQRTTYRTYTSRTEVASAVGEVSVGEHLLTEVAASSVDSDVIDFPGAGTDWTAVTGPGLLKHRQTVEYWTR